MADPLAVDLHALSAETASGNGPAVDTGTLRSLVEVVVDITAIGGTNPSVLLRLETSPDGTTGWRTVGTPFVPVTSAGRRLERIQGGFSRYIRAAWTLSGTGGPTVTFQIAGTAHVLFATEEDVVRYGLPTDVVRAVDQEKRSAAILAASDEAAGYLNGAYVLPLTAWGRDLTKKVSHIAAAHIMGIKGFDPDGADAAIEKRNDDAISWLKLVAAGRVRPPGIVDSTPETVEAAGYVASDTSRGW